MVDYSDEKYKGLQNIGTLTAMGIENPEDWEELWALDGGSGWEEWYSGLLRNNKTGKLFTQHGSHCSCYGYEGQWGPEPVTEINNRWPLEIQQLVLDYLKEQK